MFKTLSITLLVILTLVFCKTKSNETTEKTEVTVQKEEKVELCVGSYRTEEEAAAKLKENAKTYNTLEKWKVHAKDIKNNIFSGSDLDKISQEEWNVEIKVVKSEKQIMDGYTVENISLEVKPGYFVSGNLYRPTKATGKLAAILSPHGHWFKPGDYGRFRADMQKRCASLAKMGSIVFAYDMYGTGEDTQHRHHDPDALKWQTYNSTRILDWISAMPDIDTNRIGVTGASGGGTQTFIISALDDRVDVSVPVVMVSAHFFGGCSCESGKPIHKNGDFETNNVEIAASFAPKPLMLIGDGDDWTRNLPKVEFPFVQNIYKLFDAEKNVEYAYFKDEVHDYGFSKRVPAYEFLAKHLNLDLSKISDNKGIIDESFVTLLDTTALKSYPDRNLVVDPMSEF